MAQPATEASSSSASAPPALVHEPESEPWEAAADAPEGEYQLESEPWEVAADAAVRPRAVAYLARVREEGDPAALLYCRDTLSHMFAADAARVAQLEFVHPRAAIFMCRLALDADEQAAYLFWRLQRVIEQRPYFDETPWLLRRMTAPEIRALDQCAATEIAQVTRAGQEAAAAAPSVLTGRWGHAASVMLTLPSMERIRAHIAYEKARRKPLIARNNVAASGLLDRVAVKARGGSDVSNLIGQFASAAITREAPLAVHDHATMSWKDAEARALLAVSNKDGNHTDEEHVLLVFYIKYFYDQLPAISNPQPESRIMTSAKMMIATRRVGMGRLLDALQMVEGLLPDPRDESLFDYVFARCPAPLLDFMRVAGSKLTHALAAWQERQAQKNARYASARANVDAWLVAHPLPAAASSSTPARKLDTTHGGATNKKPNTNGSGARARIANRW